MLDIGAGPAAQGPPPHGGHMRLVLPGEAK